MYSDIKRKIKKVFYNLKIYKKKTNVKNVNDINNQQNTKNVINKNLIKSYLKAIDKKK